MELYGVYKLKKKSNLEALLLELADTSETSSNLNIENPLQTDIVAEPVLADIVVLKALSDDTANMEAGEVDEEFPEIENNAEFGNLAEVAITSINPSTAIKQLIKKSNNRLRCSGSKKSSYRVQPSDSNNPPAPDLVLKFLKAAKISVIKILKPGAGASTKFNTYIVQSHGSKIKFSFVYGQGRNKGQKFEEVALDYFYGAMAGEYNFFADKVLSAMKVNPRDIAEVSCASAKQVSRPLSKKLTNVGSMISDIDIKLKTGKIIHVSLKNESGVTLANSGYGGSFIVKATDAITVVRPGYHSLDEFVIRGLGIDKKLVANGISDYANKIIRKRSQIIVNTSFNADIIKDYLASAYGYGYWYVRQHSADNVEVLNLTTPNAARSKIGKVVDVTVMYPFYSVTRASKQLTAKITTTAANYVVEIRNSQGGVDPNEIKVKIVGTKK